QILISFSGGTDVIDEFYTVRIHLAEILYKTPAASGCIQRHGVFIIAVITKSAEDILYIFSGNALDDFKVSRSNVCRAGNQYFVDYGIVDFPLRFLHKGFPYAERTLISSKFLGEHFALLRLAVYHIQHIHR